MKTSSVAIAVAFLLMIAGGYLMLKSRVRPVPAPNMVQTYVAELPVSAGVQATRPEKWERLARLFQDTVRYAPTKIGAPLTAQTAEGGLE